MTPREFDDRMMFDAAIYHLGYWMCGECGDLTIFRGEPGADAHIASTGHAVLRRAA